MELRVLELMNNFPEGAMLGARNLGNYCVFGYYDALDLDIDGQAGGRAAGKYTYSSWENRSWAVMRKINGDAKVIDLSLAFPKADIEKEKAFWNDDNYAFLAVSIIRTDKMADITATIASQNQNKARMAYYSYEHCEVLTAYHADSYQDIVEEIHRLRSAFSAVKIYTIFAVADSLLDDTEELKRRMGCAVKDEHVSVRMNATMHDPDWVAEFQKKLRASLMVDGKEPEVDIYDLLGDDDLAIEINDIPLWDMLVLYKKGGLLNHSNKVYQAAFYNVETRFLLPKESLKYTEYGSAEPLPNDCSDSRIVSISLEKRKKSVAADTKTLLEEEKPELRDLSWIKEKIGLLQQMFPECASKEEALSSYIVCVVKMLNGLVQIRSSHQHKYEREILFEPMKVFTNYFIEQTQIAIKMTAGNDIKSETIQNIENAICRVSDIYENALNRTANTDKQMFMSLPVNTSMYELSPKLYAHYAGIVREMRYLFDKEDQYAIFLNPTLKRALKEEILFGIREEKGKVVVVDIPVGMMDLYDFLPLCLVHEIFHVLTSEARNRKKRACAMWEVLITQVETMIFRGITFSSRREIDVEMKYALTQEWLPECRKEVSILVNLPKEDREMYAGKMNLRISKAVRTDLYQIESRAFKDMRKQAERLAAKYSESAGVGDLSYLYIMEHYEKVKKNVRAILSHNAVAHLVKRLMHLFKETYADVASLLVVPELRKAYGSAFFNSIQFNMNEEELESDKYQKMRQRLVEIVIENDRAALFDGDDLNTAGVAEYNALDEEVALSAQAVRQRRSRKSVAEKSFQEEMTAGRQAVRNPAKKRMAEKEPETKRADEKEKAAKELYTKNRPANDQNHALQEEESHVIMTKILFRSYLDYLFECKKSLTERIERFSDDEMRHWEFLKEKTRMGTECGIIDLYRMYEGEANRH